MFFKYTNLSEVIFHDFKDNPAVLRPDDAHEITLRSLTEEELEVTKVHHMSGFMVTVIWERDVPRKVLPMFESLAQHRLPEGSDIPPEGNEFFDPNGTIKIKHLEEGEPEQRYGLSVTILPKPLQEFTKQLSKELPDYTDNFLRTLRWRGNASGPHQPLQRQGSLEWSLDNKTWHYLPEIPWSKEAEYTEMLKVTDNVRSDVEQFVREDIREPLGHELFYEAMHLRPDSPRSALILGIAAAEVGLKQCVSFLAPDTDWLMRNLPSPPIITMLQDYLPTLPVKNTVQGKVLPPPKSIMDELKKGVGLRNKVVHSKAESLKYETLRDILWAVRDLLWLLDYYSGHQWAWEYIRASTRRSMEYTE
jgi:hypothetical protein